MEGNDVLKNVKRGATADNTVYAVRYAHPNCPTSLRNIAYTGTVICSAVAAYTPL